ncbi:MAG: hypothetical protein AB8B64_04835 [Granulosicoccus sp.]
MNPQPPSAMTAFRSFAVTLVLFGCAAAITTHLVTLLTSGLNPVSSPISALAWTDDTAWFRYGLWLFALGHVGLVLLLNRPGAGRFTRGAQFFLLINALLIFWLPGHFASVSPTEANSASAGPLWLLGGGVGFAMTSVAGALWRSHRSTAFLTLVCLLLWSILAPIFFALDPDWIGAYQRSVGVILLIWTAVLAIRLGVSEPAAS